MNGSCKPSSLLQYGNNYSHVKSCGTDSRLGERQYTQEIILTQSQTVHSKLATNRSKAGILSWSTKQLSLVLLNLEENNDDSTFNLEFFGSNWRGA